MIEKGFKFEPNDKGNLVEEIILNNIYNNIFKNKDLYLEKLYESFIEDDELLYDVNGKTYDKVEDIIDKYYREYGLSINDLKTLDSVLNK